MKIEIIKCLQDNYCYLVIDESKKVACVVDPSEAKPIINYIENSNLKLKYILNTHHHYDHVGGNSELKKKYNSIIVNYDHKSNYLFQWYQQLVAESLGKKGKGILPIISTMPKDNHSVMQLYLDGFKNNFFTFFSCKERDSNSLNKTSLLNTHKKMGSYNLNDIILKQKNATENVFTKKNIREAWYLSVSHISGTNYVSSPAGDLDNWHNPPTH